MTIATDRDSTKPVIRLAEIPRYFGGGDPEGSGIVADYQYDHALEALIALTGRGKDDAAVKLIDMALGDALADLLEAAFNWGRCVPDGQSSMGIDDWDDEVLFEVTGHRRPPVHPDTHIPT